MSQLAKIELLPAALAARVDRIKSNHDALRGSFENQINLVAFLGLDLLKAKEEVGHGRFTAWRKAHLPEIPDRTCTLYMGAVSKSATVADLDIKLLAAPDHEITTKEHAALRKGFYESGDGKTITSVYRGMGLIRQPKRPGSTPSTRKDVRLTEAQRDAQANENICELLAALELARDEGDFKRLTDDTRDRARDLFIELGKLVTATKKAKRK